MKQGRERRAELVLSVAIAVGHDHAGPIWRLRENETPRIDDERAAMACPSGAVLPELGCCNRRQIAKLAGLAPLAQDSGLLRGKRAIQGGRPQARRVLYQCALVAARHHPHSRAFYLRLRANGKPQKLALVALARKLLVHLNSLLRPAHPPES